MKKLEQLRSEINKELERYTEKLNGEEWLGKASQYSYRHIREYSLRSGKRIRSLLLIISYLGYSGRSAPGYLTSSISLELIQSFILAHDDIIDGSSLRRGRPTLHKMIGSDLDGHSAKFDGGDVAMVIGDIIFALGIRAFLAIKEDPGRKEEALKLLLASASYTGCGEINELLYGISDISKISSGDILNLYDQKTGNYTFTLPLLLGATLAGANSEEKKKLAACGKALGRAFQICDDMIDAFGSEKTAGKSVLSDLNGSKKTFLARLAYDNSSPKVKSDIKALLGKNNIGKNDRLRMRDILLSSGAKDKAQNYINTSVDKARELIDQLKISRGSRDLILALSNELFPQYR